jgi:vancomycin permeability regulator SanA
MKLLKYLIFAFFFWVLVHLICITIDGLRPNNSIADIGIVLGTKVNEDGTLSARLQKRLECGLALYQKKQVKKLIVSGGLGKEGHWEGTKMKAFLLENAMPDSCIIVDNYGNNTLLSAKNSLKIQDSLHFQSIIIVSQYYHLTRSKMLFAQQGFTQISSASPVYFEWRDVYSLLREFPAYYKGRFF